MIIKRIFILTFISNIIINNAHGAEDVTVTNCSQYDYSDNIIDISNKLVSISDKIIFKDYNSILKDISNNIKNIDIKNYLRNINTTDNIYNINYEYINYFILVITLSSLTTAICFIFYTILIINYIYKSNKNKIEKIKMNII